MQRGRREIVVGVLTFREPRPAGLERQVGRDRARLDLEPLECLARACELAPLARAEHRAQEAVRDDLSGVDRRPASGVVRFRWVARIVVIEERAALELTAEIELQRALGLPTICLLVGR